MASHTGSLHQVDSHAEAKKIDPAGYYIYGRKRFIAVIALSLVLFISSLDSTIVSVALSVIGSDFDDYARASWIVTAYLITYTGFLPVVSKFTDVIGRKPVLVSSTLFFMAFSGACGGAKTMNQLIVFRALQGIGGSAIYSAVIVTISTMVPRTEVPKYTPMIGVVYALSSVAGPLVGGAIISHVHWGWIFYVNLPIGLVGSILLLYSLKDPHDGALSWRVVMRRIDWIGSFLLLAISVLLSFALQVGGTAGYPWVSASVLAPLVISGCLVPLFVYVESGQSEPLVPLRLFRIRNYAFIIIFTICLGAGFYTVTIYLPQRMEIVTSLSPITSGVRMLPMLLLIGLLSCISGAIVLLAQTYRPLLWFSACVGPVGCGMLSTLTAQTIFPRQYGYEAIVGFSVGATISVSTMVVQFSTDRPDLAVATGFQSFARQMGALVAIAAADAILNARVNSRLVSLEGVDSALQSASLRQAIIEDPEGVLGQLSGAAKEAIQAAYSDGFSKVFIAAAAWMAVGALATVPIIHMFPSELENRAAVSSDVEGTEGADDAATGIALQRIDVKVPEDAKDTVTGQQPADVAPESESDNRQSSVSASETVFSMPDPTRHVSEVPRKSLDGEEETVDPLVARESGFAL